MVLNVPTKLNELTLGGLIALSDYIDLVDIETKRPFSEEEKDKLYYCLSEILQISENATRSILPATANEVKKSLAKLSFDSIASYVGLFKSGENPAFIQSTLLSIEDMISYKTERDENKGEYWINNVLGNWFKNPLKKETFYISSIEKEPTLLWISLLDGVHRRSLKVKTEEIYKIWKEIPMVLASLAWRKGEDRLTKSLDGKVVVDMDKIELKKQWFLQVSAVEAIKVFGFFLRSPKPSLSPVNIKSYLKQTHTQSSQPVKKGKTS